MRHLLAVVATVSAAAAFGSGPAAASTLTAEARTAWGGSQAREVALATSPAGDVFALPEDRRMANLGRLSAATLTTMPGWTSPFVIKGRTTGFAWQRGFVAASAAGTVAVFDPNRQRLLLRRSATGAPVWAKSLARVDRRGVGVAPGDVAFDRSGRIHIFDSRRQGTLRFGARGSFAGLLRLPTAAAVRRMDVRGDRIALLTGGSSGGPTTLLLAATTGGAPRRVATFSTAREYVIDVDLDSAGRPRVLIFASRTARIEMIDPATGAVIDRAELPLPSGAEFMPSPRFLELDAEDRPVVSAIDGITRYGVAP